MRNLAGRVSDKRGVGEEEVSFRVIADRSKLYDIPCFLIRRVINSSEREAQTLTCTASWFNSSVIQAEPRILFRMTDGTNE